MRPRFFLFGACPKRKNPPRPRQKKLAAFRFRGFRRSRDRQRKLTVLRFPGLRKSRENSAPLASSSSSPGRLRRPGENGGSSSAPSFFLSKSDPLRWALIWLTGRLFLVLRAR